MPIWTKVLLKCMLLTWGGKMLQGLESPVNCRAPVDNRVANSSKNEQNNLRANGAHISRIPSTFYCPQIRARLTSQLQQNGLSSDMLAEATRADDACRSASTFEVSQGTSVKIKLQAHIISKNTARTPSAKVPERVLTTSCLRRDKMRKGPNIFGRQHWACEASRVWAVPESRSLANWENLRVGRSEA